MDLIYAARYTEVCDYSWDDYNETNIVLPGGIWHVDPGSIPEFFNAIKQNSQRYVVVSPSCDYCICEQKYNHPALDLEKWVGLNMSQGHGYNDLHMAARINRDRCKETDRYSIKCWSYTEATFPEIPDNVVCWFLVNCQVHDDRLVPIPFGIYGNKNMLESAEKIANYPQKPKDKLLYVNFQFYTTDRFRLFRFFHENFGDMVTCKRECFFDEYLNDLATHKFVLCPTGNGFDCYRTLETIYMGGIPILEKNMGAVAPYVEVPYPTIYYPHLLNVDPRMLESYYDQLMDKWYPWEEIRVGGPPRQREDHTDLTTLLWPYWKDRIEACRSKL